MTRTLCILVAGMLAAACGRGPAGGPAASNKLLIVGYDREPDTLNRFSTHILEDIQTCVIEGLTITDDHMTIQPLLAAEVPTLANNGVTLRQGRRDGRHLAPASRHQLARRHAAVVRGRQVHGGRDQRSVLQPGEHRRLRSDLLGRHSRSAHCGRPLPRGLRALRAAIHARPVAEARAAGTRHRSSDGLQPVAARHRSVPRGRVEERRIHPAGAGAQLLARRPVPEDRADPLPLRRQHQHPDQPAEER